MKVLQPKPSCSSVRSTTCRTTVTTEVPLVPPPPRGLGSTRGHSRLSSPNPSAPALCATRKTRTAFFRPRKGLGSAGRRVNSTHSPAAAATAPHPRRSSPCSPPLQRDDPRVHWYLLNSVTRTVPPPDWSSPLRTSVNRAENACYSMIFGFSWNSSVWLSGSFFAWLGLFHFALVLTRSLFLILRLLQKAMCAARKLRVHPAVRAAWDALPCRHGQSGRGGCGQSRLRHREQRVLCSSCVSNTRVILPFVPCTHAQSSRCSFTHS